MTEAVQTAYIHLAETIIAAVIAAVATIVAAHITAKKKDEEEAKRPVRTGARTVSVQFGGRKPEPEPRRKPWKLPLGVFCFILLMGIFMTSNAYLNAKARAEMQVMEMLANAPDFNSSETAANMGDQYAALGMQSEAEAKYREAVAGNDSEAAYHDKLAQSLAKQGKLKEALEENRAAIALSENAAPEELALYYNNEGVTLNALGFHEEAVDAFRQALSLETNDEVRTSIHNNVGIALYSLSRYKEALREYETAIDIEPHDDTLYYNATAVLIRLNRYDEALERIEQAIEWDPNDPENHYTRAALLRYFNEADEELRKSYDLGGLPYPEEPRPA